MVDRSATTTFFHLDTAVNRFADAAANAPGIQPLRQHAAVHGGFKKPMDGSVTDYGSSEIEVLPDDVIWRFGGHRHGKPYTLEIHANGVWKLYDRTGGQLQVVADSGQNIRLDAEDFYYLADNFMEDMRKYLRAYVGAPAPQPDPNAPTVVIPAVTGGPQPAQGQHAPSKGMATTALVASILAVPLTCCCLLPGYAAVILALFMARSEINASKRAGQQPQGSAQAAWVIGLLDIPVVVIITVLLIVSRVSGYDTGGGY